MSDVNKAKNKEARVRHTHGPLISNPVVDPSVKLRALSKSKGKLTTLSPPKGGDLLSHI